MTYASQAVESDQFERFRGEPALRPEERIELVQPLQNYLDIRDELARVALARQQAEDRERELQQQQILARNACIAHGIEDPDFVLRTHVQSVDEDSLPSPRDLSAEAQ